jgi:hypothetical protein
MDAFIFCLYRDRWVLTSAEQVQGGATLLAGPVRIVSHGDQAKLVSVLEELLEETAPIVPAPDYNNARFVNDLRLEPLGLKKWRDFVKDGRCFNVELHGEELVLEEWPRDGGSFSANALWQQRFPGSDVPGLARYVIDLTKESVPKPKLQKRS